MNRRTESANRRKKKSEADVAAENRLQTGSEVQFESADPAVRYDFIIQISDFRFQIPESNNSDFRLQISDFRFQSPDFRLQISHFRFRISENIVNITISEQECQKTWQILSFLHAFVPKC